jgi:hypothetical protein
MYKRFLSIILSLSLLPGPFNYGTVEASAQAAPAKAATPDQQAMDKLLAPIALYPDALLAQVLACASSPQQVTEVNKWMQQNSQLQGTDLQAAAEKAGFDAGFIALVLFPDVLKLLQQNLEWTTELGKAFTSDQKAVLASVQRLRAQAKAAGNLKTTPQQEVKTETQNGQTVIVVQPANPQVVYVPVYNTQTVYTAPPPAQNNSGNAAAAALVGFGLGIALGAAMNNNSYYGYHGYSAWGMHWHSSAVVVHGGAWRVPPGGRYPYARPVSGYRPNTNVYAPRNTNVNVNVNNVNVNRQSANAYGRTPRPSTASAAAPATRSATTRTQPATAASSNQASRGRTQSTSGASPSTAARSASPARQMETGARTSAFSGYQSGGGERAASSRGRSSASSSGGGRRR